MTMGEQLRGARHVVWLVNLRHLFGHRRRTTLTVIGIAASVALVVAITLVNESLRSAIDDTTHGLAGRATFEVAPAGRVTLPADVIRPLRASSGVSAVVPMLREITLVKHAGESTRTFLFGVPANLSALFPRGLGDVADGMRQPAFQRGVLLSSELAATLKASAGERITVQTIGGQASLPIVGVVRHSPFTAVNGGSFALLALANARTVFHRGDGTASVAYLVAARSARAAIAARLGRRAIVRPPGAGAQAYTRTFDSIASLTEQSRAVAMLVALFLVLNTMSMSLAERREELMLLTLNGTRHAQIIAAFVIEAVILGVVGSLAGVAGGLTLGSVLVKHAAASYSILPFVTSGPVVASPTAIALGLGAGIAVAVVGAALPARRILRVKPIDALRPQAAYEWRAPATKHAGVLAVAGLAALAGVAALAAFAPVDSHQSLAAVVFALALIGAALLLPAMVPAAAGALRRAWLTAFGLLGRLAGDTLQRNPSRATIAAGALALSASVVIAVSSGVGSYSRAVDEAAPAWYAAPLFVTAPGSITDTSDQPLPDSLRVPLSHLSGVKAVYPIRYGVLDQGGHQTAIYAMPIAEAARAGDEITRGVGISQAALVRAMSRDEAIVSRYSARTHHLKVGDQYPLPNGFRKRSVRIAGLFNDVANFDSLYLELSGYVRETHDQLANRFAVVIDPHHSVGTVQARIRRYLLRHGVPGSVLTRQQIRAELVSAIDGLFSLAKAIQLAALLIAGLIVLNTMLTATFERRREFGLQRVLGMSRPQLTGYVMLESISIALIGAAIALGLGLGLGFLMTLIVENQLAWRIPFAPDAGVTASAVGATLLIGTLAALYPSWLAGRQRLIELVGYE